LNKLEETLASLDKAIKTNPDDHKACHKKGVILSNINRQQEAIEAFDSAIKLKQDVSRT
jgi:Flp pilus assembly protein TadD